MKKMLAVTAILGLVTTVSAQDATTAKKAAGSKYPAGSYAAEVTASKLQLRAGPGASYQPVMAAEKGRKLVVAGSAAGEWAIVHVPGGYHAWVSAKFIARDADGTGTVKANRLLVRPRPSTNYHQLSGKLLNGERVKVVGEKMVGEDRWLQVRIPERIALYASMRYLNKIGDVSLAVPPMAKSDSKKNAGRAAAGAAVKGSHDDRFVMIEKRIVEDLKGAYSVQDVRAIERTLATVNEKRLSEGNRTRHLELERAIFQRERQIVISSVADDEKRIQKELDAKIKAIEEKYAKRRAAIAVRDDKKASHFTAVGIIEKRPDVLGRTPAFRMVHAGKLKYYLIAPAFDLKKFAGKRVGVIGIKDRESGTGYFTIMVKRIEILGDK